MRNFAKITFREIAAFYRETDKGKISRNNTQDTKYSIGGTIINTLDNNYSIARVSLCITDKGTFRLFFNRSGPFKNKGLQVDRSGLVRSFSNHSIHDPFGSVLGVLSRERSIPFRSVLCVLSQERFHPKC